MDDDITTAVTQAIKSKYQKIAKRFIDSSMEITIKGHCVKSVRIRSFSGPYSVRIRENTDQKNSEHGHFSPSGKN